MLILFAFALLASTGSAGTAVAQAIKNPIAIFAGLDKITGVITTFEIQIDQAKRFGALNVRPRTCNTRPVTEEPKTLGFIEVDEVMLDGSLKRIFTGWMLAESPGLNAVEHPVYDVWLTGCRDPNRKPEDDLLIPEDEPSRSGDGQAPAGDGQTPPGGGSQTPDGGDAGTTQQQ